jgi:hypothetical protein
MRSNWMTAPLLSEVSNDHNTSVLLYVLIEVLEKATHFQSSELVVLK